MITANLNTYRQSPRKVRLVSDLVKGKSVNQAIELLSVTTKSAALPLRKLIQGAVRNAKNTFNVDEKTLYIKDFRVDAGATLKRSMPRARGSAFPILKRTSHISLILGERGNVESPNHKSQITNKSKWPKFKILNFWKFVLRLYIVCDLYIVICNFEFYEPHRPSIRT